MRPKNRLEWIDIARGFFILAIVIGHVFNDGAIRAWVFSFHVPAFFVVSGFCYRDSKDFRGWFSGKVRSIVVPYVSFSVLSIMIFALTELVMPKIGTLLNCDIVNNVKVMLYGNSKPDIMRYNLPLWFLPCFFCVTMLTYGVEKVVQKLGAGIRYFTMAICAVMGGIISQSETLALPWHLETAISMLVWSEAGIVLRACSSGKHLLKCKKAWMIIVAFLLIAAGIVAAFFNNRVVGVRNDRYGILPLYYMAVICGTLGFMVLSKQINKNKLLEYIGQNSMVILVLHKFPILVFQELLPTTARLLDSPNTLTGILCGMAVLVVSTGGSLIAGEIIRRVCPWLLGMKRAVKN